MYEDKSIHAKNKSFWGIMVIMQKFKNLLINVMKRKMIVYCLYGPTFLSLIFLRKVCHILEKNIRFDYQRLI